MNQKTKNVLIAILSLVIVASLGLSLFQIIRNRSAEKPNPNVTIVTAPDQDSFEVHPEWGGTTHPVADAGNNLAQGAVASDNGHTDVYTVANVVDGDPTTYWEGDAAKLPNEVILTLKEATQIGSLNIRLNPDPIWGARTQEIEVQVSTDGETYTTVSIKAAQIFDPDTGNQVQITLDPVQAQYIKVLFHSNTGAGGGQASEIQVFAP